MLRNVDAYLAHDFDCLRPDESAESAGAKNFKTIAGQLSKQPFAHLAAG